MSDAGPPPPPFAPPTPAPPAPAPGSWVPAARPSPGLATASLVCGIVGILTFFVPVLPILAVVFGAVAIARARRAPGPGDNRGRARAGLVLGIIGIVLFAVVIIGGGIAGWYGEDVAYDDLVVGDCAELDIADLEITTLPKVSCDETHQAEVYAVEQAAGGDYPGQGSLGLQADDLCAGTAFEDYVGVPFMQSSLQFHVVVPTEETWEAGGRDIVCFAVRPDGGDLLASVRGSGI